MIGLLLSAALETYVKPQWYERFVKKGFWAIVQAAFLGAIIPGCACVTIPVARSLQKKGASVGILIAFLMASPLVSVHTVLLTFGMLGPRFAIARVGFALLGSIMIGTVLDAFIKTEPQAVTLKTCCASTKEEIHHNPDHHHDHGSHNPTFRQYLNNLWELTLELGKFFVLGILVASLLMTLVPHDFAARYLSGTGLKTYLLAGLLAIPTYVCEGEEIPLTASLLNLGLFPGPALTFLMAAVGSCIPTLLMAQKIIGKKATAIYAILWWLFSIACGLIFQMGFIRFV